jgi:large subunit ribosomal protein L10
MNRQEKEKVIVSLQDNIVKSDGLFLIGYRGLSVPKIEILRSGLRKQGGLLKVAKARLMKRAVANIGAYAALADHFKDQVGLVFASSSAPTVAKFLHAFSQEHEECRIIVGGMEQHVLTRDAVIRVASLPSREILLAQLCGVLSAPMANFARVLDAASKKRQAEHV